MTDTATTETTLDLDALKAQAELLGISVHPAAKAPTVAAKIKAHIDKYGNQPVPASDDEEGSSSEEYVPTNEEILKQPGGREKLIADAMRLVRINVTCMNPAKREWPGEPFSVGNAVIPAYSKFVPFNTTEGFHVPHCMYEVIRDRVCNIYESKKLKNGQTVRRAKQIKEFAIDVLPQLTPKELADLKKMQAAKAGSDEE